MKLMGMGLPELVLVLLVYVVPLAFFVLVVRVCVHALKWFRRQERIEKTPERVHTRCTLGQVLKTHREGCHMTQELVAQQLGVSRQAVSKWESGASEPNTTNLIALAELYGTTAPDLLREVTG